VRVSRFRNAFLSVCRSAAIKKEDEINIFLASLRGIVRRNSTSHVTSKTWYLRQAGLEVALERDAARTRRAAA
jgi:hypothetical protein